MIKSLKIPKIIHQSKIQNLETKYKNITKKIAFSKLNIKYNAL